jgi:hypothetical protein
MSTKTLRKWLVGSAFCLAVGCGDRRRAAEPPPAPPPPVPEPAAAPEPVAGEALQCGHAGMPDCPLQAWMDAQLNTAMSDGNFAALSRSLRELAHDPPTGFASWRRWAEKGADAAERNDQSEVKAACSGCHHQHRETYRRTIRGRTLRLSNN